MQDGKAAGDDEVTHEMLKGLDPDNRKSVRQFINRCWATKTFPDAWRKALVMVCN